MVDDRKRPRAINWNLGSITLSGKYCFILPNKELSFNTGQVVLSIDLGNIVSTFPGIIVDASTSLLIFCKIIFEGIRKKLFQSRFVAVAWFSSFAFIISFLGFFRRTFLRDWNLGLVVTCQIKSIISPLTDCL